MSINNLMNIIRVTFFLSGFSLIFTSLLELDLINFTSLVLLLITGLVLIYHELQINMQIKELSLEYSNINKYSSIIFILSFLLYFILSKYSNDLIVKTISPIFLLIVILLLEHLLKKDKLIRYQYNLGNGLLRNKINLDSISKDPIDSEVNIVLYGKFIQFNWKIEEKNIIWNLQAKQSRLVEYIAKLQTSEQSTFVNGYHVKISPKNIYFDETVFQKLGN